MRLKSIDIAGFKSFAKKSSLTFGTAVTAVVGPNGSGKSNVVEAFRFVLGEQSMKSMRGKSGADLIFRGQNSKLSRAAVSITFDNADAVFAPYTFDTITFTRELFADGTSKYSMNGTEIRLKQMVELLAAVNIGASSHHIISQGEADAILRVNPRERRGMLEEALGLKVYHFRIKEGESKLAKSMDTLKEVQSLRRELAPHLSFLKKQVEKIEKGRTIRTELEGLITQYLAAERTHLAAEESRIHQAIQTLEHKKRELEAVLVHIKSQDTPVDMYAGEISKQRAVLDTIRSKRREIEGRIARLEGMIEIERRLVSERHTQQAEGPSITFAPTEYKQLLSDLEYFVEALKAAGTIEEMKAALERIDPIMASLHAREPHTAPPSTHTEPANNLAEIARELEDFQRDLGKVVADESAAQHSLAALEAKREEDQRSFQSAISQRYEVQGQLTECSAELHILSAARTTFAERKAIYDTELKEAAFLFGPTFLHALQKTDGVPELNLPDIKRTIDRLKIRLDEHAGIGNDVVGEYEATVERDAFLSREVSDIESSIRNLETLIIDLKKVLDDKFTSGVSVINERFGEFFKTMFGGGSAFLEVTMTHRRKRKNADELFDEENVDAEGGDAEPAEVERGIEVHVNLPEKKVKELTMLSGGERSLVSIALLFAISQVNPPPFLVLDETDAALDEANSRRYGDMIERLSEYSQLIVVTHNRETMSRASVLYGVTLGSDGGSKLLSIKFDEAVKVAK